MNQQMQNMISRLKSIPNLKERAMQSLENASRNGNVMAKGLLQDINAGNMQSAQQTLNNYMASQGNDMQEVISMFKE